VSHVAPGEDRPAPAVSTVSSPGLVTAWADLVAGALALLPPLPRVKQVCVRAAAVSTTSPIQPGIGRGVSHTIRSTL